MQSGKIIRYALTLISKIFSNKSDKDIWIIIHIGELGISGIIIIIIIIEGLILSTG